MCDIKRPSPSFQETEVQDPQTNETSRVKGDGNIDFRGDITSYPFGYIVCTLLEIHEAFDTLVVRRGNASTDTFVCFTSRYPEIFFQKNKVPKTNKLVVVKFDTWTAFRAGAMAYRNSASQWILTTGLPIASIVMVRDHLGNCFDMSTMTMMEWKFLPTTNDEPVTLNDLVQKECIMPTCERWHCVMTEKEKAISEGIHLLDWQPYHKSWGEEYLSLRHADTNPPEKALALAEWVGSKVWHVAVISPTPPEEPQETVKWWYNPSGLNYLSSHGARDDDRSRTPLRKGKGKGDPNESPKGKGPGKKGKKPAKIIGQKEKNRNELVGSSFQVQQHFQNPGEKRNLKKLLCRALVKRDLDEPPWCSSKGRMESPIFRRSWISSDAPVRTTRVLDNRAGDPRLWDPSDTDFWSVCVIPLPQ